MTQALAAVAPGTPLREGLDRILQAKRGALIVLGDSPEVLAICSGGLILNAEFSPQRISELAKMDGAIILASDASRIARANVHLVPDPAVPTSETGTRHRTAERVARSLDLPVISVSEDMSIIAVYVHSLKHQLQPMATLVNRANQALQTLERYKQRLDTVTSSLSALEIEDLVTVRDVVAVLQRAEMVRRIAEEIDGYLVELGDDGRMLMLQLDELMGGVEDDRRMVIRDYAASADTADVDAAIEMLADLPPASLLDLEKVSEVLQREGLDLDTAVSPRGYRLLSKIPRIPGSVVCRIVEHYGTLERALLAADQMDDVEGIGEDRASQVREGLARIAEVALLDRPS